ncbi:hypothetical protein HDV00_008138 [Rhizophlyctis rosea]|nr:hypothetical protein HDV00_008138 [Rhizophlyctis rosea]
MSKTVERYYQESGRAGIFIDTTGYLCIDLPCTMMLGRDGLPSECLLFYRPQDLPRITGMVVGEHNALQNVYGMVRYAQDLTQCRRTLMERYFGVNENGQTQSLSQWGAPLSRDNESCGNCDTCLRLTEAEDEDVVQDNVAAEALTVLGILMALRDEEDKVTLIKLVEAWRGVGKKYPALVGLTGPSGIIIPPPKWFSKDDCERIVVRLLLESCLKEEFHFTPYQTVAYLSTAGRRERIWNSGGKDWTFGVDFLRNRSGKRKTSERKQKEGPAQQSGGKGLRGETKDYYVDDVATPDEMDWEEWG